MCLRDPYEMNPLNRYLAGEVSQSLTVRVACQALSCEPSSVYTLQRRLLHLQAGSV
jgi:hypothetical protein